ncbi:DUF2911 domain-containing protein [Hyphobacterium sp. CCMP332]|nr:DUF2911 domain-containing protein [Hyphobacterium sp. CCMP332]
MKKINLSVFLLFFLFIGGTAFAQKDKATRPSPPATAMNTVNGKNIKIDYSQPAVKDRVIWGELVPYEEVWRTGANEATTIEFSQDVSINGESVKAGKYSLFTVPNEDSWMVILNSEANQWGAYKYNEEKDVLRFKVKPQKIDKKSERLTFDVKESGKVSMMWDELMISFDVN